MGSVNWRRRVSLENVYQKCRIKVSASSNPFTIKLRDLIREGEKNYFHNNLEVLRS